MAEDTLILGGGFGGLATAHALRERLGPGHPITVVDRRDHFYVGLRKLWVLVGAGTIQEGSRPLFRLEKKGIRFVRSEIRHIDPGLKQVETDVGTLRGEHLVVALGAEPRPDLIPGLEENAFNLYDPRSVEAASERITTLWSGRLAVVIAGLPYKCPPAPYEAAFMLDAHLRERGVREAVELAFSTLQPGLLPNAGPEGARWIGDQLSAREIRWRVGAKPVRFGAGRVVFEETEGEKTGKLEYDLAVVAPPHRAPRIVKDSELAQGGEWISVDRKTLETSFPGVYAIGDVTHIPLGNDAALPKAGLMAESQGIRVAHAIAARIRGDAEPPPFDGTGACYLEMGVGRAALIEGDFFADPVPDVRVGAVTEANFQDKIRFERERLDGWLG